MRFFILSLIALCILQLVLSDTCPAPTVCPRGEDYECGNSNTNSCCNGTCFPRIDLGASCNAECEGRCVEGAACIRGTCLLSAYGCSCTSDTDCSERMICQNSTCQEQPTCNSFGETLECPSDQICWDNRCQVGLPLNSSCSTINQGSQCAAGSYCGIDSTCQPNHKLNETCDSNNCEAGLFCDPNGRCVSTLPNGSTCLQNNNCQSFICLWDARICSSPLDLGQTCSSSDECESGLCQCPGYNGTATSNQCTRKCTNDRYTLVDGSYCSTDDQCRSQFCLCLDGPAIYQDCKMARCTPRRTVEAGGNCTDSAQCQTVFCNAGTCIDARSVPIGGACQDADVCPFGGDCTGGVCVSLLNGQCKQDYDCGNDQECMCQSADAGICSNSSTPNHDFEILRCLENKRALDARICLTNVENGFQSLASCQASIADYACCFQCDHPADMSNLEWVSGYTVDCRSRTITPTDKQPCCGAKSRDCFGSNILNCDAFSPGSTSPMPTDSTTNSMSTDSTSDESSASQMAWISFFILSITLMI